MSPLSRWLRLVRDDPLQLVAAEVVERAAGDADHRPVGRRSPAAKALIPDFGGSR